MHRVINVGLCNAVDWVRISEALLSHPTPWYPIATACERIFNLARLLGKYPEQKKIIQLLFELKPHKIRRFPVK